MKKDAKRMNDSCVPRDRQPGVDLERRRLVTATGQALAVGATLPFSTRLLAVGALPSSREIDAFRGEIQGTVVLRDAPNYEPWRRSMAWNYRKFGRYPDMIVQAEGEDDVVATIAFAKRHHLPIKVRSGGHSWSGCYMRDSGILLDISHLRSVEIDTETRTAVIGPGVLGRDLNERLRQVGLAFPTAHCGMVPLSGFLMGGGLGLNGNKWGGMSVFNIKAVDLITADGEKLHANEEQNAELFWAVRGGGPGLFCVVTRFYLQCHPLPAAITTDTLIFPYSELIGTVAMMEEIGPAVDPALEMLTVVVPASPELAKKCGAEECRHVVVLSAMAFADTADEADSILAPIRRHPQSGNAIEKFLGHASSLEILYQENEGPFPQRRARADNIYTNEPVEAAKVVRQHMPAAPSAGNTPVFLYKGELEFPEAAYSSTGKCYLAGYAQWDHAADDPANQAWLRDLFDDLQPLASGYYINEFDRETRSDITHRCFAPENWKRLQELRGKFDPEGVFHDFLRV
ncbi:FAD-binding oxidoreductase [Elongatibacter sediminis]|uniref:FAD-binding oxidoreductase n=1 Tax=Elongatibacter sediminis TaxID=3119006 RepID=A0AAW9R7D5_9GAMM